MGVHLGGLEPSANGTNKDIDIGGRIESLIHGRDEIDEIDYWPVLLLRFYNPVHFFQHLGGFFVCL